VLPVPVQEVPKKRRQREITPTPKPKPNRKKMMQKNPVEVRVDGDKNDEEQIIPYIVCHSSAIYRKCLNIQYGQRGHS